MNESVLSEKYEILATLGRGGMADVSLAMAHGPAGFEKLVVVKELRPELAQDAEHLSMFMSEARLGARLVHPTLVQVQEIAQDGERLFMAMEFLDGQPLHRVLARLESEGGLPLAVHLSIISEVLAGLDHAHRLTDWDGTPLGVVHRDVSPHNVFVTYDGRVKLVDFGIAKGLDSPLDAKNGTVKGKAAYMAPEQAEGADVDRRADVYSAGVMIWEALAGARLFQGLPDRDILKKLLGGEVPSPCSVNPDVPPELERVCMKALARLPADRWDSAGELREALRAAMTKLGLSATSEDVGGPVAAAFAAERAELQGTILRSLRRRAKEDHFRATSSYPPRQGQLQTPLGFGTTIGRPSSVPPSSGRTKREAPTVPPPGRKRRRFALATRGLLLLSAAGLLVLVAVKGRAPAPAREGGGTAGPRSAASPVGAAATARCGGDYRLNFDLTVQREAASTSSTCSVACTCENR
ncbi:MAG TPA: serine/threonine-protein kinase [Polyangiaceae bacterium]|nr:serine/threonine-protein kinase [Polyangiaceae bacterium]